MSTSDRQAVMTMAASTDWGRFVVIPGAKTSRAAVVSAPTTPASWVFAPACSATGVRDALALIEKPWKRPAPAFATPSASSSWFWSTRSPARAASVLESTLVSAIDTTAIASPPAAIAARSSSETAGTPNVGRPCGNGPTTGTPADAASPRNPTSAVPPTAAISTPGIAGSQRRHTAMIANAPRPTASAAGTVSPSATPTRKSRPMATTPSPSTENPNNFGQLADEDGQGDAVEVPDPDRLREQVREETEAKHAERDAERARDEGKGRRQVRRRGSDRPGPAGRRSPR